MPEQVDGPERHGAVNHYPTATLPASPEMVSEEARAQTTFDSVYRTSGV